MGCCQTAGKLPQDQVLIEKLQNALDSNSPDRIRVVMNVIQKNGLLASIDEPIFIQKEIALNPLSYSLWQGNLKSFKCLYEEYHAKVSEIEKLLNEKSITPLDIICEKGYHELLVYYIPLYIEYASAHPSSRDDHNVTVEFDKTIDALPRNIYSPVQKACEMGNIHILLTIFNYFKGSSSIPPILDLEYQDEHTGENCVLIACRNGNYSMLKFLHEIVKADFHMKNKRKESAINVCLAGNRKRLAKIYLECLIYLIETVKVDFLYQYEESLLIAQDYETIKYLEYKLSNAGIKVTKQDLEDENKIKVTPVPKTELDLKLDEAEEFNVGEYIDNEVDRSALSSIANFDSHLETPFISVFGNISILKPNNT